MFRNITLTIFIVLSLFTYKLNAENFTPGSIYVAKEIITTQSGKKLQTGLEVEGLGIVEVAKNIIPSGLLFTFLTNGDQVHNADFNQFELVNNDPEYKFQFSRSKDLGQNTDLCGNIIDKSGKYVDLLLDDLNDYLLVNIVDGPSIATFFLKIANANATRFCISGLEYATNYEIRLLAGFRDLTHDLTSYNQTVDRKPKISIDVTRNILPLSDDAVIPISVINIEHLKVEVIRIDERSLTNVNDLFKNLNFYDKTQMGKWNGQLLGSKIIKIPSNRGKEQTFNIDVNDIIGDVKPGVYAVVFASEDLKKQRWHALPTQWFVKSNIGITLYSGNQKTKLELRNFSNLLGVSDATVKFIAANNRVLYETMSGKDGNIAVPNTFLNGSHGNSPQYLIIQSPAGDFSFLNISNLASKPRFLNKGLSKKLQKDIYLTTDREMYRGGDTIHYAVIGRNLSLDVLNDTPLNAKITDPAGKEIDFKEILLNSNGLFKGSVKLRGSAKLGTYQIYILTKDETVLASASIKVDDFVPLTIETEIEIDNQIWSSKVENLFKISSKYYSGGVASGLKGTYTATLNSVRMHESKDLNGYVFGGLVDSNINVGSITKDFPLDDKGHFNGVINFDKDFRQATRTPKFRSALLALKINAYVFDVGGRPNYKQISQPVSLVGSYLGVRPNFKSPLAMGSNPSFEIVTIDRLGNELSTSGA